MWTTAQRDNSPLTLNIARDKQVLRLAHSGLVCASLTRV
jgi:hypothetical protein